MSFPGREVWGAALCNFKQLSPNLRGGRRQNQLQVQAASGRVQEAEKFLCPAPRGVSAFGAVFSGAGDPEMEQKPTSLTRDKRMFLESPTSKYD